MPRTGFYNDNEYRAYPFIYQIPDPDDRLPTSAIVDAGIVLRLSALPATATTYTVWLASVTRTISGFLFTFKYNSDVAPAPAATPLTFFRHDTADDWVIAYEESASAACLEDPVWSGFLVTGPLVDLREFLAIGATITFLPTLHVLEPARIQNLQRGYLRSISIGNYDHMRVAACVDPPTEPVERAIVFDESFKCLHGDIRFKEGYNCRITQTDRTNTIDVTAVYGAGAKPTDELCEHGGELPFTAEEAAQPTTDFYSGGPKCSELITTINGLAGPTVTLVSGIGVDINATIDPDTGLVVPHSMTIKLNLNAHANCT